MTEGHRQDTYRHAFTVEPAKTAEFLIATIERRILTTAISERMVDAFLGVSRGRA